MVIRYLNFTTCAFFRFLVIFRCIGARRLTTRDRVRLIHAWTNISSLLLILNTCINNSADLVDIFFYYSCRLQWFHGETIISRKRGDKCTTSAIFPCITARLVLPYCQQGSWILALAAHGTLASKTHTKFSPELLACSHYWFVTNELGLVHGLIGTISTNHTGFMVTMFLDRNPTTTHQQLKPTHSLEHELSLLLELRFFKGVHHIKMIDPRTIKYDCCAMRRTTMILLTSNSHWILGHGGIRE